jgi:hypothetical protein
MLTSSCCPTARDNCRDPDDEDDHDPGCKDKAPPAKAPTIESDEHERAP